MNHEEIEGRRYPIHPRVGVGIVLVRGDKVLLVKRGHEPAQGQWSVPGGLINVGETVVHAAERELMEECGISADFHKTIDIFEFIQPDLNNKTKYHFVVIQLLATYKEGDVAAASDAVDARWVRLPELDDLACTDKIKELVQNALVAVEQKSLP